VVIAMIFQITFLGIVQLRINRKNAQIHWFLLLAESVTLTKSKLSCIHWFEIEVMVLFPGINLSNLMYCHRHCFHHNRWFILFWCQD
jgi:hypothetical protein